MNRIQPDSPRSRFDVNASLARATLILVAAHRQAGDPDEKIEADIRAAIREALESAEPTDEGVLETSRGPALYVSASGVYRKLLEHLGLDRSNQWAQERWFAVVERALAEALTRREGEFGIRIVMEPPGDC